jgi:hypothetical protein
MELWEWAKEQASNAWDWVTSNDSIPGMVGNYVNNRINNDERAALLNSQALTGQKSPSLSGYEATKVRSTAGISGFDDIKEASNNRYASFLYYVKAHLQAKKQLENIIPIALHRKTGLGSRK